MIITYLQIMEVLGSTVPQNSTLGQLSKCTALLMIVCMSECLKNEQVDPGFRRDTVKICVLYFKLIVCPVMCEGVLC